MMQFRFEERKVKWAKKPQQKNIATSIRRLTVAQRMNTFCNTIEMGGSFMGALNAEENICRRN